MTEKLLDLTRHIVAGYVANNSVPAAGLPALIAEVAAALSKLSAPSATEADKPVPAVSPKRSVFPHHIVSLETGEGFKSLTRHLSARGLTPDAYRSKWGLPRDYPMVAPEYSAARSALAKKLGLGRKPAVAAIVAPEPARKGGRKAAVVEAPAVVAVPKKSGRPAKAAGVAAEPVRPAKARARKAKVE